jgi:hypothetical protein
VSGRDMEPLLPVVSERVGASLQNELLSATTEAYVMRVLTRLSTDNPCIANFIAAYAAQQKDPTAVTTGAVLVYRLLESQAEADRMRREFGLDDAP